MLCNAVAENERVKSSHDQPPDGKQLLNDIDGLRRAFLHAGAAWRAVSMAAMVAGGSGRAALEELRKC